MWCTPPALKHDTTIYINVYTYVRAALFDDVYPGDRRRESASPRVREGGARRAPQGLAPAIATILIDVSVVITVAVIVDVILSRSMISDRYD